MEQPELVSSTTSQERKPSTFLGLRANAEETDPKSPGFPLTFGNFQWIFSGVLGRERGTEIRNSLSSEGRVGACRFL